MKISLENTGKRYNREWIFRKLHHTFGPGGYYAITGPNGSGKSTLLQVIAGAVTASEGNISYQHQQKTIAPAEAYAQLAYAAPYMELVEEMTLREFLRFHQQFKPFYENISITDAATIVGLEKSLHKPIGNFSSGMKQRLKLAQAFFSATTTLLLDEPTSNLDKQGIAVYQQLLQTYRNNRLLIISSNDETEYAGCDEVISILDYKS
jgi:ABC-type multidrug transport system ATPase subunit